MVKVRVLGGDTVKVKLRPTQGVKVGSITTYLYDPTIIDAEVQQAKDWAIKTDGIVEEDGEGVDYSAKAYAVGGLGTTTNNAKYYAEQAGLSATSASNSATTATAQAGISTTQAGIATTQAGIATNKASEASTSATNASYSSATATNQATIATNQAGIATTASNTATLQAGIATAKATEASGYASSANVSSQHASTSETNANIWAEGSDAQVSLLGGEKSSKGWAARAKELVDSIGSVLHYKGSVYTRADLPITGQVLGDMYNITSDGSNVVWNGSDWDDISGIVDLSAYRTASDQDTIDAGKVPTTRTVNNKALSSDITLTASDVSALPSNTKYGADLSYSSSTLQLLDQDGNSLGNPVTISSGSSLPSQTGHSGEFLTTDGTDASWSAINALQNTATGTSSITILGTASSANSTVNIGYSTSTTKYGAIAIGYNNSATGSYGIAIGETASASGNQGVAVGRTARANYEYGIAIGFSAEVKNTETVAIGHSSEARGYCSVSIGTSAVAGLNKTQALALGYKATANANYAIQLGYGTNSTASTLAVGFNNTNYTLLDGTTGLIPPARHASVSSTAGDYYAKITVDGQGNVTQSWDTVSGGVSPTYDAVNERITFA